MRTLVRKIQNGPSRVVSSPKYGDSTARSVWSAEQRPYAVTSVTDISHVLPPMFFFEPSDDLLSVGALRKSAQCLHLTNPSHEALMKLQGDCLEEP
jgi:hypothetical protein